MDRSKVLVVDDDPFFRRFCSDTLQKAGHEVLTASSGEEAIEIAQREPLALIVVDIYMPKMSGIELLEEIKSHHPSVDVIVSTGYASVETAVQALKKGASDYLRKPFAPEELTAVVGNILEQRHLYQVNEVLKKQLRLYELSRSFAAVEEPYRVAALGLDALREMSSTRSGFCVHLSEEGGELEVWAHRNMAEDEVERAKSQLPRWQNEVLGSLGATEIVSEARLKELLGEIAGDEQGPALLVPVKEEQGDTGFFVLYGCESGEAEGFDNRICLDSDFIGGQIALAFKASARFQEAKAMAYVDSLTDLYNSRYLPIILDKRIAEASDSERPLSLLFIDLDNFRDINSNFGHQAGSKTIIEAGWILESNVRAGDTVIRYGGDEFTIVLPNADTNSAREIAERIRKAVEGHHFLGRENKIVRLTACIGVATYPDDATNAEALINLADQAMYRGKETTRNVVYAASDGKKT